MYKLPKGIRIPKDVEHPENYDIREINAKRDSASIIEGYKYVIETDKKWEFSACINVDSDKQWELFNALVDMLFKNIRVRGLIGFKNEEPNVGDELEVHEMLDIFGEYEYEILNDGYIEFGIANFKKPTFCEIYMNNFKTMFIWANGVEAFKELMKNFGLREVDDLAFISDFPVVSEALIEEGVTHYSDVIGNIEKRLAGK